MLIGVGIRSTGAATAPDIQQRIDRICGHIPPPVIMEGERPGDTTLRALMEKLHVPGISVAVIHDGMIEWARGFGVRFAERLRSIVALNRHVLRPLAGPIDRLSPCEPNGHGHPPHNLQKWSGRHGPLAQRRRESSIRAVFRRMSRPPDSRFRKLREQHRVILHRRKLGVTVHRRCRYPRQFALVQVSTKGENQDTSSSMVARTFTNSGRKRVTISGGRVNIQLMHDGQKKCRSCGSRRPPSTGSPRVTSKPRGRDGRAQRISAGAHPLTSPCSGRPSSGWAAR